ncbi:MAG: tyrosine-type recombinase/integrase [Bacteroidaceae bacterium]|nr:tyrosine-type recombinase/integrase [Bacteroidaceae bacterium]
MKEKVILEISNAMAEVLSVEQMAQLNAVLLKVISKYNISQDEESTQTAEKTNDGLLRSFLSAKQVEGCSVPTVRYYGNTIKQLYKTMPKRVTEYTTEDIRAYLAVFQRKRKASRVTVDNVRRIFSSFFAWLEEEDYIIKSPVRRIHKVKTGAQVREVLTDESLENLRDTCVHPRDLAMIDLLASTGMRVGELVKLNREDINFNERECIVFGKGNKERIVYFNARAKIHLQDYLNSRRDKNKALFVSLAKPYRRLQISGVEVRLRKIGKEAKVPRVHPHKFRRTLATMAIDKGMPVEQVQKLLGHVKIDTTMHYAMVNQNNVKLSHRRFLS